MGRAVTRLNRPVRRTVSAPRRDLVVALEPCGDEATITVREKGRRHGYTVTVRGLFMILAQRAADLAVLERARKRRRKAPR